MLFFVSGTLGAGKSLVAAGRMFEWMRKGLPVATNMDLFPEKVLARSNRATVYRLPDWPTSFDLDALPTVAAAWDEANFGLIVLDEAARYLNSRNWNDKDRAGVLEFFRMLRRKGWHLMLLVQDVEALDKQVRNLEEYSVRCARLDRFMLPVVGRLVKAFTGYEIRMPRVHVARVWYQGVTVERWWYTGQDVQSGYDTGQVLGSVTAPYSLLSAWHLTRMQAVVDWACLACTFWWRWLPCLFNRTVKFLPLINPPEARPRGRSALSEREMSSGRQLYFPLVRSV